MHGAVLYAPYDIRYVERDDPGIISGGRYFSRRVGVSSCHLLLKLVDSLEDLHLHLSGLLHGSTPYALATILLVTSGLRFSTDREHHG